MTTPEQNKTLWKLACVTDPAAVKPITGKQYKGNSPKPYWIIERATELLGPCGIGWGLNVLDERIERFGDHDTVHIARVRVWYVYQDKRGEIEQMGQTKMSYMASGGKFILDEDAPKKSVTDAMVKCLSMIGFAGDIFSGRWDDSGYVAWAASETERRNTTQPPTLNDRQITEITTLINQTNTDFEKFMGWVSKCVKAPCAALSDVPAMAYEPVVQKLKEKMKETA